MKEINLPPFYPTQKVVCVDTSTEINVTHPVGNVLKRGQEYIVLDVKFQCCKWVVDIGIPSIAAKVYCSCGNKYPSSKERWFRADRFRPIQENFQEISYSEVVKEEKRLVSAN